MKKTLKYSLYFVLGILLIYLSVYIKPLDEHLASTSNKKFDAKQYADLYWREKLPMDINQAFNLIDLNQALQQNQLDKISKKVGISDFMYTFFYVNGKVKNIDNDFIYLITPEGDELRVKIKFIFDSNVRNASKQIDIGEFTNIIDYNLVSKEINNKIRTEVIDNLDTKNLMDANIKVVGAIQIHEITFNLDKLVITPVNIKVLI